jgi:carbon monoxide dehydrogenase subunit G
MVASPTPSADPGTTRGSVRRDVRIARTAEEVWALVGQPALLHHWFPGIDHCVVSGTHREITLATGATLSEEILTNDPIQRRFQYTVVGGVFREHLATIDVIALADDDTLVIYSTDAAPATLALVLGGAAGAALDELRRQLETGSGSALNAAATTNDGGH